MANRFTLDNKDINSILKSNKFKERLEKVKLDTNNDIFHDFELSEGNGLILGLMDIINDNKLKAGGLPKGSINFGEWEISIDDIFDEIPWLKQAYENALKPENEWKKEDLFKSANIKLVYTILLLLSSDNVEAIYNPKIILNIKKLIIDGQEIEKPKRRRINIEKFVARDNVAKQLANLRNGRDFPEGTIELRPGMEKNINRMSIFNHFKILYKSAKTEEEKVRLDTQFSEQIILKAGYYIQIDNKFIDSGDINFKDEGRLISDMNLCRDSLNIIGFKTESLIIEDESGETYYIVRKKSSKKPNPQPDPEPDPQPDPEPDPQPDPEPDPQPDPEPDPQPDPEPDPQPDPEPFPQTYPEPDPQPDPEPDPQPDPEPDPQPDPEPDPQPDPRKTYIPPKVTVKDDPDLPTSFEENVVISDVSDAYEDMISREVENGINEEWHNTHKLHILKYAWLFLARGRMRKERIKKAKKGYEKTAFTANTTINKEMAKQAARHDLEEVLQGKGVTRDAFGKIDRKTMIKSSEVSGDPLYETERGKEFKELCQDYVAGRISQIEFQNRFNKFVKDKLGLPKEQQFIATNILEKLDAIKNDNDLLSSITADLNSYLNDHDSSHFDAIRTKIDDDFKKYKRDPRFRAELLKLLGNPEGLDEKELNEKINKFLKHQKALAKMSTQNLQIKLDLLTNGKGAYQTNNKDREGWLFRVGHALDKMPWYGQLLALAGVAASGMIAGGAAAALGVGAISGIPLIGTISGAGLIGTATLSSVVGLKTFVKKWTHHTKEQNTYEKNLVRDYKHEIAQMREREKIRTEKNSEGKYTHGWLKRYSAKRQLELYGETTQALQDETSGNTREIVDIIYQGIERYDSLNPDERNILNRVLMDAKARLETYWALGHNFLKSKNEKQIERDFYDLENSLNLCATRVLGPGATLKDISLIEVRDTDGNEINYHDFLNEYKKDYKAASKRFRGERAWLATKWGVGMAAATFISSSIFQAAFGKGMFAKEARSGTPDIEETITKKATDFYDLGKFETNSSDIFRAAQDNISNLDPSCHSIKVVLTSGTDGTPLAQGSSLLNPDVYRNELLETIEAVKNSCISNKAEIIRHLEDGLPTQGFTNHTLYSMRDLNAIEQIVTGSGNYSGPMEFVHDVAHGVDGHMFNDKWSRFTDAVIKITKTIPGQSGGEAGEKWLVIPTLGFSNEFKLKNDGKPEGKNDNNGGNDNADNGDNEKGDNNGGNNDPIIILPPVDPDDPAGPTEEAKPREKITGKTKGIITRGHEIYTDIDDLGVNYPLDGKLLSTKDSAYRLLSCWQNGDISCFTKKDVNKLRELKGNEAAQLEYLEAQIVKERDKIEHSKTMEEFNKSMEISKQWIREFLPEILGDVDSKLLNDFMSDDRIHVVSDYEYIGVIGESRRSSGVFRLDGDIYIRYSYIQQHEDDRIYSDDQQTYRKGMHRHSVLIHEMIHSMSTMNYIVSEKNGKREYDARRIGLQQFRYDKNGSYLSETGRSLNEASTEALSWEILTRGFNSIGLDMNPHRNMMSYKPFINVLDRLQEIDHIEIKDFWRAMLIRKRAKDKKVEFNTPFLQLISKINGRNEENGKIKDLRPNYYNLISNSMDFSGNIGSYDTKWIVDFITKKDIKILKKYVDDHHKSLSDVFDKDLLTKDGTDFKQEILDAYKGR